MPVEEFKAQRVEFGLEKTGVFPHSFVSCSSPKNIFKLDVFICRCPNHDEFPQSSPIVDEDVLGFLLGLFLVLLLFVLYFFCNMHLT